MYNAGPAPGLRLGLERDAGEKRPGDRLWAAVQEWSAASGKPDEHDLGFERHSVVVHRGDGREWDRELRAIDRQDQQELSGGYKRFDGGGIGDHVVCDAMSDQWPVASGQRVRWACVCP